MSVSYVRNGETVTSAVLGHSDSQHVLDGGVALYTKIKGGEQNVSAGGEAKGTKIFSDGEQEVEAGGVANST